MLERLADADASGIAAMALGWWPRTDAIVLSLARLAQCVQCEAERLVDQQVPA
jgi:hypothetical protein